jgi:predicted RNA-binding protein
MKPTGIENTSISDIMETMRSLVGQVVRISVK